MNSMKCFILHLPLFIFFLAGSARADGGDVLDRIVRLPGMKGTVYALLGKVSEQSGYLFIYDSKVIHNDSVVRVRKQECSVRQAAPTGIFHHCRNPAGQGDGRARRQCVGHRTRNLTG